MKKNSIGIAVILCGIIIFAVWFFGFRNNLVGTWETQDNGKTYQFVFNKNGTGSIIGTDRYGVEKSKTVITWETEGDELFIKEVNDDDIKKLNYEIKNNELILTESGYDDKIILVKTE